MPRDVPLRVDILAGLGGAQARGQGLGAQLESIGIRNKIGKAELDKYYEDVKFKSGLSSYIKAHPDIGFEEAGEQYSLSAGRPQMAAEFREAKRRRMEMARARLATFTDAVYKYHKAGMLDKNIDVLREQFPEFKDFDPKRVETDNHGWVTYEVGNGDLIASNAEFERAFLIPKKSAKWQISPKSIGGQVVAVNMNDPTQVMPLGKWPEEKDGGKGTTGREFAQIAVWEYMQRELGISKDQLKQFVLSGKFKTDDQIATAILTKIAGTDMGPIDWDAGLSDPKSKEGQKVGAIYGIIMKALKEARGEIGEESVKSQTQAGVPKGIPPNSEKGTYKGKPAWRAPDGTIYVEE